ncbi:Uncharacterized protein PECH_007772 [Penicillium ucsense]|uniref:DUF202 domain-containing protein n=1 Tax=Penicillium ucsense TaxID=2839758 RepID=A0A8J8WC78_9EURO|nr:Uncharacterized protein PECM_004630 [Penicillium ucsense]KAF7734674.1 Uncharacterized protein PECH_007772 [Penicillium ucsense]
MMTSILRRLIPKNIPNTGSQQRDHHANERTFLSWTRAGLGFAAMALALDRLDSIDRVISAKIPRLEAALMQNVKLNTNASAITADAVPSTSPSSSSSAQPIKVERPRALASEHVESGILGFSKSISASRLCQVLGLWSLGYGFFRYWSMRRYLLKGQFVPAFWGPVLMTTGSFGAFMMLGLQMDRRRRDQPDVCQ